MKKVILVLLGFVITVTGFSAFAVLAGCRAPECKTIHMNKSGGMHKHMRQLDEIDKLLILVNIDAKKQMFKKFSMQKSKMQKHGWHPMAKKHGRSHMSCTAGKACQMGRKDKKISARHRRGHGFKNNNAILKSYLLKNYPKEMKELVELKKNNNKAAKDILEKAKKIVSEAKTKMKAQHEQFVKMIKEYKKSKDPKIAKQIKVKLSEFHDIRLDKMKEKIDKAYTELKKKKANKDKEVMKDFERITK